MNNKNHSMRKIQFGKIVTGIALCLSITFSGSILLTAQPVHAAAASSHSVADKVITKGKQYLGVPYRLGASKGDTDEFDCSSFTQYLFKQSGIHLPRTSKQQSTVGVPVKKSNLKPGDLIFSDTNRDGVINHVSIYMGNGKIIHTYQVGIGVTISKFTGSTWDKTFVTARRVI